MLLAASMILPGFIALIRSADILVSGAAPVAKNTGMWPVRTDLERTVVTLFVSSYALYYYSLQSAL